MPPQVNSRGLHNIVKRLIFNSSTSPQLWLAASGWLHTSNAHTSNGMAGMSSFVWVRAWVRKLHTKQLMRMHAGTRAHDLLTTQQPNQTGSHHNTGAIVHTYMSQHAFVPNQPAAHAPAATVRHHACSRPPTITVTLVVGPFSNRPHPAPFDALNMYHKQPPLLQFACCC